MAIVTVWMGSLAKAFASGVTRCPVARKTTIISTSPSSHETELHFAVPLSGAGGGGWKVIIIIDPRVQYERWRGRVPSQGGGGTGQSTVWVCRWWACCFSPAAKSSDGVVERGWGGGFAFLAAAVLCDGVDERVFMVEN